MRQRLWPLFLAILFCGCPGVRDRASLEQSKTVLIDDYSFVQIIRTDSSDTSWHTLELAPAELPYSGKIARLSAQTRWLHMFHNVLETIRTKCKGSLRQEPEIRGEEHNYTSYANSPTQPKYLSARFACAKK